MSENSKIPDENREINKDDKEKTQEIPDNTPWQSPTGEKGFPDNNLSVSQKQRKQLKKIKTVYAFAVILALGAAFTTKLATEKSLGNLQPIEDDYVLTEKIDTTSKDSMHLTTEPDFQVRQNAENVPDTRNYTEKEDNYTEVPSAQNEGTEKENKASQEENTTKKADEKKSDGKFSKPYEGEFYLPFGMEISRDYSPEKPVYNSTMNDWRTHPAVDFSGAEGDQVKAVSYGTVTRIYKDSLLGTVVEIDHGNEVTARYCGINPDTLEVVEGREINGGELIGYLGEIPYEKKDGAHLHFEIIYKGKKVEPLELMGR